MKHTGSISLVLVCSAFLFGASGNEVLLDETAAIVAARIPSQQSLTIITRWELEAQCRLELIRRYGKEGMDRNVSKALRSSMLETIIDETPVFMEVSRLGFTEVDENAVRERLDKLVAPFEKEETLLGKLKKFSIKRDHVMKWIKRSILVDQYIDAQFYMSGSYDASDPDKANIEKTIFRSSLIEDIKKRYRIWVFFKET